MSHGALRDFLRCYARHLEPPGSGARGARGDEAATALALDELQVLLPAPFPPLHPPPPAALHTDATHS